MVETHPAEGTVARREGEHGKVAIGLSRNPKADYFEDRGNVYCHKDIY
jgi:hypothetical protein